MAEATPVRPPAQPVRQTLDIKTELATVMSHYQNHTRGFKALVYGGMGTGKTNSIRTARRPVLVHSFDPGGTTTIRDEIEKGGIFVDNRFEIEDPMKPTVFEAWDKEYHRLKAGGIFDQIGTFVVDSATTWAAAAMNVVLRKAGRLGGPPYQQDYLPAMAMIEGAIRDMTTLPCDVILIAHEDVDKDEISGRLFIEPMFVGKLKKRIPILFDEIYYATTKESSAGTKYFFQTQNTNIIKARSRLGSNGRFQTLEDQDFKALLKKAGISAEDKQL